jgi:hypothetical protein
MDSRFLSLLAVLASVVVPSYAAAASSPSEALPTETGCTFGASDLPATCPDLTEIAKAVFPRFDAESRNLGESALAYDPGPRAMRFVDQFLIKLQADELRGMGEQYLLVVFLIGDEERSSARAGYAVLIRTGTSSYDLLARQYVRNVELPIPGMRGGVEFGFERVRYSMDARYPREQAFGFRLTEIGGGTAAEYGTETLYLLAAQGHGVKEVQNFDTRNWQTIFEGDKTYCDIEKRAQLNVMPTSNGSRWIIDHTLRDGPTVVHKRSRLFHSTEQFSWEGVLVRLSSGAHLPILRCRPLPPI